jgi:hypothetical protein
MAQQRRRPFTPRRASFQLENARRAQSASRAAEIIAGLDRAMADAVRRHGLLARLALVRKFADLMENSLRYGDDAELAAIEQLVMPRIGAAIYAVARRLSGQPGAGRH